MGYPEPKDVYSDSGVSSKAGKNRAEGSAFCELLNVVKPNDIIIIEDCDRWSREDPITSLSAMRQVLKQKSVSIRFQKENIVVTQKNLMDDNIILPLFLKSWLGFRENTKKAERIQDSWNIRKERFEKTGKAYGQKCPPWVKWVKTGTDKDGCSEGHYEIIPEHAALVLRIFRMCIGGMGCRLIAKTLNREHVAPITKYNFTKSQRAPHRWTNTNVQRMLKGKEVLGFNPMVEGCEHKMYPPVPDLTEKMFYAAKDKIELRKTAKWAGRDDEARNLFTSIAKCSDPACGRTMRMQWSRYWVAKNGREDGSRIFYRYLQCCGHVAGDCTVGGGLPYNRVEESFFVLMCQDKFRDAIVAKIYNHEDNGDPTAIFRGKLNEAKARLAKYEVLMEKDPSDTLNKLMKKAEDEQKDLLKQIDSVKTIDAGTTATGQAYDEWTKLSKQEWSIETRYKIKDIIRMLVSHIGMDIRNKSYDVFFKSNPDQPVHVQLLKSGFRVGLPIPLTFFWQDKQPTSEQVTKMAKQHGKDVVVPIAEPLPLVIAP